MNTEEFHKLLKTEEFQKFLLEDYKLKAQYLTAHFSRMWTRFNFFLTINSALFAFSVQQDIADLAPLFVAAGIPLSALWYFFGATDNYLADVYRRQVMYPYTLLVPEELRALRHPQSAEEALKEALQNYSSVGVIGEIEEGFPVKMNLLGWRYTRPGFPRKAIRQGEIKQISATELAVILPLVFLLLWIVRMFAL